MRVKREAATAVGVGAVACAACCAGPIVAALGAIGLGTVGGIALFGLVALVVGALAAVYVLWRRRRRSPCATAPESVPVTVGSTRPAP
jgi:hypothetical protein